MLGIPQMSLSFMGNTVFKKESKQWSAWDRIDYFLQCGTPYNLSVARSDSVPFSLTTFWEQA